MICLLKINLNRLIFNNKRFFLLLKVILLVLCQEKVQLKCGNLSNNHSVDIGIFLTCKLYFIMLFFILVW